MPENQVSRRRFGPGLWYQRIPCDPPPIDLARRLAEAKVASKAAKRIDTYERFHHQHVEHRRAVVRGVLGATGLLLSVAPGVPSLITSCGASHDLECGLRISAMVGGALALTVTGWAFWDLYHQPSRLSDHVAKLNAEMARSMQSRNGDVAVERLFDLYRGMSRHEQIELKSYLHERAAEPQAQGVTAGNAEALALSVAVAPSSREEESHSEPDGYSGDSDDDEDPEASSSAPQRAEASPRWKPAIASLPSLDAAELGQAQEGAAREGGPFFAVKGPWHGVTLRRPA